MPLRKRLDGSARLLTFFPLSTLGEVSNESLVMPGCHQAREHLDAARLDNEVMVAAPKFDTSLSSQTQRVPGKMLRIEASALGVRFDDGGHAAIGQPRWP